MLSFGERLKRGRKAAGLSLRALGEAVGLSANALSKYERGAMNPSSGVVLRLADALGVRPEYFTREIEVEIRCPAFRKHSGLSKTRQGIVEGRITELLERYLTAESFFDADQIPSFTMPEVCKHPMENFDDIEDFADEVRSGWGLGTDPIANVCEVLEDHGVKVILLDDVDQRFDGYSCWTADGIPVVAAGWSEDMAGDRQRFSLCHELGHLLLEHRVPDGLDVEKVCHRFAGAFLVPQAAVRKEMGGIRGHSPSGGELYSLKHKWGLSMQAWVRRLYDVKIISEGQYRSACQWFSENDFRHVEPGDPVQPERTERSARLIFRAVAEDLMSVSRGAELLGKPVYEMRKLMRWPQAGVAQA